MDHLLCNLWKGPLKVDFLDIYLTTSFKVGKFKNTSAMSIIFFLKIFKIESKLRKCKKKLESKFLFWDNCSVKCCFRLSLLRREYLLSGVSALINNRNILHITQGDFSTWIAFAWINKYGKAAVLQISTVFRPFFMLLVKGSSETGLFRHLSNHLFQSP